MTENSEILRIKDFLKENPNLVYTVFYGKFGDINLKPLIPLNHKASGVKPFERIIPKLEKYKADFFVIQYYETTPTGNVKREPYFQEKIILSEQRNALGGFQGFGSLGEYVETRTNLAILQSENKRLDSELTSLRQKFSQLENKNLELERQKRELEDKKRDLEWKIKDLERKCQMDLEDTKRKYTKIEKILEIAGVSVAKAVGLDKDTLTGLLGIDELPQKQIQSNKEPNTETEVSFEPQFEGKKEQANELRQLICNALLKTIEQNNEDDALFMMEKMITVYNYLIVNRDTFNRIYELAQKKIKIYENKNFNNDGSEQPSKRTENFDNVEDDDEPVE